MIFSFYINAEKFSDYTEVAEPEYSIAYEVWSLLRFDDNDVVIVENGKYKVIDREQITYLTVKNSKFDGKIYIYDKNTNKRKSEYSFKNGIADGKWTEYDKNEKPATIDYIKDYYIMKREIYVNGKLVVTKTFKDGLYMMP